MGIASVLIIVLAVAVVLVIAGGVMTYMGNLLKIAYEIKVRLKGDIDERLTGMNEDAEKKTGVIKQELVADIDKARVLLVAESDKLSEEFVAAIEKRVAALEEAIRAERGERVMAAMGNRQRIAQLDGEIRTLFRDLNGLERKLDMPASIDWGAERPGVTTSAPAPAAAPPAPPPEA